MFATAFHTSRHYILFTAMACLCVLLGGPSYAAGADSLFIAGDTYYEPGVSGPGWAWTDADHLELTGYVGEAIGADGDLVVTLVGQNSVVETHAPDADISMSGMEVWGNLTLRGSGSLTATGSQCGIHVAQALVVDGCTVDARADGAGVVGQTVAGIAAGSLTVRGGERVVAAGAGSDASLRFYGVRLLDEGFGTDAASKTLVVDESWLDATGTDAGVACDRGSLVAAHFVTPAGGAFSAASVVDADGAVTPHVVIEPDGATGPAGETESPVGEVPGDGTGEPTGGADPSAGQPGAASATDPAVKPAATPLKTTVAKTTVTKTTKPKSTMATTTALPKTGDSHWIAVSLTLFLLGTVLLSTAYRC
ncbi:hypothetical protein [Collinsella aerofaciens]|uniref:hypothetical protein n=3 Tax=Collinsella aerofaciens TaxID=74426 RepID=UPI0034A3BCD7